MTAPAAIGSDLEALLLLHIRAARLPEPQREYRFAKPRRWRFDFAWPVALVALEAEGGNTPYRDRRTGELRRGRHVTITGFEGDAEKYNEAAARGWLVIRATAKQIEDGRALLWVERLLAAVGRTVVIGEAVPA